MPGTVTVTERTHPGLEDPPDVRRLPELTAPGVVQMAIDAGLLTEARWVTLRRYLWSPPAVSLGKFQRLPPEVAVPSREDRVPPREHDASRPPALPEGGVPPPAGLPFDVVQRPSGGRAVLHGAGFEWSFAVAFPAGWSGAGGARRRDSSVDEPYRLVSAAMADALAAAGVGVAADRDEPYRRSALCFSTSLRHDLHTDYGKVVAVAQVRRAGVALVHGSVLMRRPPQELIAALESLVGEPWRGDGLESARGVSGEAVWVSFCEALRERLHETATGR